MVIMIEQYMPQAIVEMPKKHSRLTYRGPLVHADGDRIQWLDKRQETGSGFGFGYSLIGQ